MRIALELKKDADEKMVMAYLFKHTPLQTNFPVNLTCLVPTEGTRKSAGPSASTCTRCSSTSSTSGSTSSRSGWSTSSRRCKKRIHILEGFEKVFDALDEILKIVRRSEGKADAAAGDHQALRVSTPNRPTRSSS